MLDSWKGGVCQPLEVVADAVEESLERAEGAYQVSSGVSLGRRMRTLSIRLPFKFTLRVREEGLVFWHSERRPSSSIKISPLSSSLPFMRSFFLEVARRLPGPPWRRTKAQREEAHRIWLKLAAVSTLIIVLGSVHLVFFTNPLLPPISAFLDLMGILLAVGTILLTHPGIESRIQRRRWSRWIQGPEMASLGWTALEG